MRGCFYMEVDFVTLGDASERLNVPPPTLRNWTDQVEEYQVHFVKRNNRNERVYYDNDIEIFAYIRDLKQEHGRKTTMRDITEMMVSPEIIGRFNLRSEEDAPVQNPSNKTGEMITKDDFERIMDNQRVKAIVGYLVAETTDQLRGQVVAELRHEWEKERDILRLTMREEIKKEVSEGNNQIGEQLRKFEEEQKNRDKAQQEKVSKREEESIRLLRELLEQRKKESQKGLLAKLFGTKSE
jgi:DNA-binding transcriptional MerR regulator